MTPQFLRAEAARFREMAESAEREASRQRLLGMAVDYEARAKAAEADQPLEQAREAEPEPTPDEPIEASISTKAPSDARPRRGRPSTLTLASGKPGA